jgi:hypothetical protein
MGTLESDSGKQSGEPEPVGVAVPDVTYCPNRRNSMRSLTHVIGKVAALAALAVVMNSTAAYGQNEKYVELMREDLKTEKVAIVTEALQMTDDQSSAFWPIYREYDLELSKLGDRRLAIIKSFADNYDMMTDETAKTIADDSFKLREDRVKLQKKYYKKAEKELGAVMAARWMQTERIIENLIDLQLAANLPLIQKGGME